LASFRAIVLGAVAGTFVVPAGNDLIGQTLVPEVEPPNFGPPLWSGISCNGVCPERQ
jgi:hypothetical protein